MLTLAHTLFDEALASQEQQAPHAYSSNQTTCINNMTLEASTENHFRTRLAQFSDSALTIVTHQELIVLVDKEFRLVAAVQRPSFETEVLRTNRYYLGCDESTLPTALRWKLASQRLLQSGFHFCHRLQQLARSILPAPVIFSNPAKATHTPRQQRAETQWHTVRLTA